MADAADNADSQIEAERMRAVAFRKPVPTHCECGEPCAVLPNGARSKYCDDCLSDFQAARND